MFCKNCGQQIDNDKKFCKNCGTGVINDEDKGVSGYKMSLTKNYKENIAKVSRVIIGILIVGGFLVFQAYNSLDEDVVDTNNKAMENFNAGDSNLAIEQFQEASNNAVTDSNKINSLKNLAYVYSSEGDKESALSTFKEALVLIEPNSFDYYLISGEINLLEKKPNAALADYNIAYSMSPDDFQINNALTLFYLDIEDLSPQSADYAKSLVYAKKAYNIDKSEISKENLAISNYFNDNFDETIKLLSSSDLSKSPYLAYWMGLAYFGNGDEVNAKAYFVKAMNGGVDVTQEIKDFVNAN